MNSYLGNSGLRDASWVVDMMSVELEHIENPDLDDPKRELALDIIGKIRNIIHRRQDNLYNNLDEFLTLTLKYRQDYKRLIGDTGHAFTKLNN